MSGDSDADGRWVTYAELAAVRGIDRHSAVKLSFRRHWRSQKDNYGTVRVCVPPDWLRPERETSGDVSGDMSTVIRPLEAAISTLRVQLDRAEAGREAADRRADQAEARADQAEARADTLRARLEGELHRAKDDLALIRAAIDQSQAEARKAHTEAEELRRAEAARRARGVLARLRAAWRGE